MRKYRFLTTLALILPMLLAPLSRVAATKSQGQPPYAPGEVIVKLKAGAPLLESAAGNQRLMSIARMAGHDDGNALAEQLVTASSKPRINEIISDRGLDRVFVLKLKADTDVRAVVEELRSRDDVEYAEPNYLIKPGAVIPNDPEFSQQWALLNSGIYIGGYFSTPEADIKASDAWDITVGSPNVVIALTDTGIDQTHPDLINNIYTNPGEIPNNGIDDDHNGYIDDVHGYNVAEDNNDISDAQGHGTQMAGVIAAQMNNDLGISGICQSKIMPVKFYKRYGPGPSQYSGTVADAARSLIYSIAAGASIINASWVTLLDPDIVSDQAAQALADAVKATNDAGVLMVCIAGNEGYDLDFSKIYPASYFLPNQIVVAASDFNDEIWRPLGDPFVIQTGFGPHSVPIAAPGVAVLTTQARGDCSACTQETDPLKWYTSASGTSVSAACVSGVAALTKSKYPNDSAILLKRRILQGVDVKPNLADFVIGGGRLNAVGALTTTINITPPTLHDVTYKVKKQKLFVYGTGMQEGMVIVVGKTAYPGRSQSDDGTAYLAKGVPAASIPGGTPVQIKLRNPDGGESSALTITR